MEYSDTVAPPPHTMDPQFNALMLQCKVSAEFTKFCTDQGILDAESFGHLAASEADVKADIIVLAKAAQVPFATLAANATITELCGGTAPPKKSATRSAS